MEGSANLQERFIYALTCGNIEWVKDLMKKLHNDPDLLTNILNCKFYHQTGRTLSLWTPIMYVSFMKRFELAKLLIENGVDLNYVQSGTEAVILL